MLLLFFLVDLSHSLHSKHQITSLPGLSTFPTEYNMYSGHLGIGNSNLSISENGSLFYWLLKLFLMFLGDYIRIRI